MSQDRQGAETNKDGWVCGRVGGSQASHVGDVPVCVRPQGGGCSAWQEG